MLAPCEQQATAKSRIEEYSFDRNQPGQKRRNVTIGQRTELGTTLLIELDGITAHTVYFRCLLLAPASFGPLSHAKFLIRSAPSPGQLLLRNDRPRMPLLDYKPNALFLLKEEFLKHQDELSC